tara:strand:+ start:373 stop:582 length:210 start_codon:yes stop_codon:yes gene_type:complete
MKNLFNSLFTLFCIINVLFWGFFSHEQHCRLAYTLGSKTCPPHWVHVYVMAPIFLLLGVYSHQGSAGLF